MYFCNKKNEYFRVHAYYSMYTIVSSAHAWQLLTFCSIPRGFKKMYCMKASNLYDEVYVHEPRSIVGTLNTKMYEVF